MLKKSWYSFHDTQATQGDSSPESLLPSRPEAGVQKRDLSTISPAYQGPKKGSRESVGGGRKDKSNKKGSDYTKNARSFRGNQAAGYRSTNAQYRRKETTTVDKIDRRKAFEWNTLESPRFEKPRGSKPPVATEDCSALYTGDSKQDEKLYSTQSALDSSGESKDNGAHTKRTHSEYPRSARRGRGKGKQALGNKKRSQQNTQDSRKAFDCRIVEPQTEKSEQAQPGIKTSCKESDCNMTEPQCENSKGSVIKNDCESKWPSLKLSTSEEGLIDERNKSVKPPPGFEVTTRRKVEPVRLTNVIQAPPGFEKHISFSRPLP